MNTKSFIFLILSLSMIAVIFIAVLKIIKIIQDKTSNFGASIPVPPSTGKTPTLPLNLGEEHIIDPDPYMVDQNKTITISNFQSVSKYGFNKKTKPASKRKFDNYKPIQIKSTFASLMIEKVHAVIKSDYIFSINNFPIANDNVNGAFYPMVHKFVILKSSNAETELNIDPNVNIRLSPAVLDTSNKPVPNNYPQIDIKNVNTDDLQVAQYTIDSSTNLFNIPEYMENYATGEYTVVYTGSINLTGFESLKKISDTDFTNDGIKNNGIQGILATTYNVSFINLQTVPPSVLTNIEYSGPMVNGDPSKLYIIGRPNGIMCNGDEYNFYGGIVQQAYTLPSSPAFKGKYSDGLTSDKLHGPPNSFKDDTRKIMGLSTESDVISYIKTMNSDLYVLYLTYTIAFSYLFGKQLATHGVNYVIDNKLGTDRNSIWYGFQNLLIMLKFCLNVDLTPSSSINNNDKWLQINFNGVELVKGDDSITLTPNKVIKDDGIISDDPTIIDTDIDLESTIDINQKIKAIVLLFSSQEDSSCTDLSQAKCTNDFSVTSSQFTITLNIKGTDNNGNDIKGDYTCNGSITQNIGYPSYNVYIPQLLYPLSNLIISSVTVKNIESLKCLIKDVRFFVSYLDESNPDETSFKITAPTKA